MHNDRQKESVLNTFTSLVHFHFLANGTAEVSEKETVTQISTEHLVSLSKETPYLFAQTNSTVYWQGVLSVEAGPE